MAVQSVLSGECDIALVGGGRINVPQKGGYIYEEGGILSPDGFCRAFDADARGTMLGNGVAMIVIKRLSDAIRDGDTMYAVIKGTAINNDGSQKIGFTAPSVQGQSAVIEEALAMAEVSPETVGFVEAHGTGTPLGDPIEIAALSRAFGGHADGEKTCAIGSIKTNIGHFDAGAGVLGVIKASLSLKHQQLLPTANYEKPNPQIDFENSRFYVNTELRDWPAASTPRRAGVSSFGLGGTNAHIVLEESPEVAASGQSRIHQLVLLSAKTLTALDSMTDNLADHLERNPSLSLADVAYTLKMGRARFDHRRMIACSNLDEAVDSLKSSKQRSLLYGQTDGNVPSVVFMFSGQGAQYVGMGLDLYRSEPVFKDNMDHCCELIRPLLSLDLRDVVYPAESRIEESSEQLKQTAITQPALFSIEYALARLWMSWGIQPDSLVGHSIGEYVAACLAGVFTLEDALSAVVKRGELMQSLPAGSMLAVHLSKEDLKSHMGAGLSIAATNSPGLNVVSGESQAIQFLEEELTGKDIQCRTLQTSHAFHSAMMDPILEPFTSHVRRMQLNKPQIPFVSNVSGSWITPEEATDARYWAQHIRQTVRFSDCVEELLRAPKSVFLEVGPGRTLNTLVTQHLEKKSQQISLSSIRHPNDQKPDDAYVLTTLGRLWMAGVEPDWSAFYHGEDRRRIPLPGYPFERKSYWINPRKQFFHDDEALGEDSTSTDTDERDTNHDFEDAPRNESERLLAEIWQDLLGIGQVGASEDFFELGGSSLIAVRLFAEIERVFGKKLPLATLYEAPTVELLAEHVQDGQVEKAWGSLVEIQSGGAKPTLFCVHAAGGNVLNYRDLALHLGPDQPVYGLQAQGLDGRHPCPTTIEEMAEHYVKEIKTFAPDGPYMIGGYCMGGTVALEMAQQLLAQGDRVVLLALFETYNWAKVKYTFLADFIYYVEKANFHMRNLMMLDFESKKRFLGEKAKELRRRSKMWAQRLRSNTSDEDALQQSDQALIAKIWDINDAAARHYKPKTYPGRITLFRPTRQYSRHQDDVVNWAGQASCGVDIHDLPVYPGGMLTEPFVSLLAEALTVCIQQCTEDVSGDAEVLERELSG
jgi:acyl transferase domain-containing protein